MRRMYSKKQLEELISQMSGDILEVKNVKQLNDEQCNGLKVGDIVAKKTGKQYHCYIVTFKQDKGGLCLSYFDASCIETQSYDYTAGHWVYNSEDKTALVNVEAAPTGEIQDVLGLDAENKLVKGAVSGGTKLFKWLIQAQNGSRLDIISTSPESDGIINAVNNTLKILDTSGQSFSGVELIQKRVGNQFLIYKRQNITIDSTSYKVLVYMEVMWDSVLEDSTITVAEL